MFKTMNLTSDLMEQKMTLIRFITESNDEDFLKGAESWRQLSLARTDLENLPETNDKSLKKEAKKRSKPVFSDLMMTLFTNFYTRIDGTLVENKKDLGDLIRQGPTTRAMLASELEKQIKEMQFVCWESLESLKPHLK